MPDNEEQVLDQEENLEEQEQQLDNENEQEESESDEDTENIVDDSDDEQDSEEEKPPSRREQLRIQQVLKKYGPPPQREQEEKNSPLNYRDALQADDEVYQQLESDRQTYGKQREAEALQQVQSVRWETRLEADAPRVEADFPILDSKSDDFNPAVANAVNTWYLNMAGFDAKSGLVSNPSVRYREFVEGFMELVSETASERVQKSQKNITRQAAKTGLRPDGSQSKRLNLNKDPSQMSDEELNAAIKAIGLESK